MHSFSPVFKMSSHSETFVLISDVGANKRRNCCLSCLIAGWTLWNGPHGRSWRGAGRAWYQSSVVLLFHARLESTSLWTRLREWRHCRAETGKEIPQTFGTKLKAKSRYDELCFDWTSCAKMTGWYLQFNHSGVFYLQASFVRAPFSFSLCSFV